MMSLLQRMLSDKDAQCERRLASCIPSHSWIIPVIRVKTVKTVIVHPLEMARALGEKSMQHEPCDYDLC